LCNLPHATESCGEGTCVVVLCDAGWSDCDSDPTNGCETSLATVSACGSCGNACDLTNASSTCSAGTCGFGACRAGYASCDDDTSNGCETAIDSPAHCGGCSTACAGLAPLCTVGIGGTYTCVALCAAPTATNCSSSCVDLATNARNCGTCGNVCTGQHAEGGCAAGLCTVARCDPGWGNCDSDVATGCETPTTTVTDCGSCGSACNVAHGFGRCETGTCEVDECEPGWGDCNGSVGDGCETSVTSAADCGECGTSCSGSTPVCGLRSDGTRACLAACADPAATNCGGTCIDARYDEQNCGSCDNICALTNATSACIQSMCVVGSCDAGFGNCDGMAMNGCETNILVDVANCGGCGLTCEDGNQCTSDRCDPIAQNVGADIQEQQRARYQEEGDHQQHRHEADEDVGDDQLPSNAPEQTSLEIDVEAVAERNGRGNERDVADGVERGEPSRAADNQRQEERDDLDRRADEKRASDERADQPLSNDIDT